LAHSVVVSDGQTGFMHKTTMILQRYFWKDSSYFLCCLLQVVILIYLSKMDTNMYVSIFLIKSNN